MRKLFVLCLLICSSILHAQDSKKPVVDLVFKFLQELGNPASGVAYQMLDSSFQQKVSQQRLGQLGMLVLDGFGVVKALNIDSVANDGMHFFTATYLEGTAGVQIKMTSEQKISYFTLVDIPSNSATDKFKEYQNPLANARDSFVHKVAMQFMNIANTRSAIIGVVQGTGMQIYGYGETTKGSKRIPKPNDLYEIGSITKTFTSTLLALEVIKGKMKLNDPVNKYLSKQTPTLQLHDTLMRLVHLSNHSSGFGLIPKDLFKDASVADPYAKYTSEKMLRYLLDTPKITFTPGTKFSNSNYAVGLLGEIMALQNNTTYEGLLEKQIWNPLGMNDTRITLNEEQKSRFVPGYTLDGVESAHWNFTGMAASGGIRSTMADMVTYARAMMWEAPKDLSKAFELMRKETLFDASSGTRVALGWLIIPKERTIYAIDGGTGGFSSLMVFEPNTKTAVIVLTNVNIHQVFGMDILDWLLKNQ
ncbi:CubicO group peptidase (beta-lactamase class C family) [Chitinophaga skermanii]|uniref:CubicO group peptidase (Beta-lactamase class C family) n=1 Tax=Chitinophaga skermanii TaxID=331697 RepID=A0A327QSY5_9BACT|nr:serine hydrolase domain-containing protein [Chitinophaga skermanii]RAJ06754.1 CubicO group peptidase (beta-lactamase class C family) [Chitinophaga skermanii]